MSSKSKGNKTERELLHMFFSIGWVASRIAGSGSIPLPNPDLIAGKDGRILSIECKSGKGRRYLTEKEINELKEFSSRLGAEAWIAARFDRSDWFFLKPEDLGVSKGGTYFIDLNLVREKGILFGELVKDFKQFKLK